jgi:uncharacterized protein YmfQ (DUF2313 family)
MSEAALAQLTEADYLAAIQALLPTGPAWPRDPDANLTAFWGAPAAALLTHHQRALALLKDSNPLTTSEMLSDWERVTGLPDECSGDQIVGQVARRAAVVQRLASRGGQSRAYYIGLAASLGFTITITEFQPFYAGQARAGQALTNGPWQFTWRVNSALNTIRSFAAGQSGAGDPLRSWGNAPLECAIRRAAPAHTYVKFGYA